jgi:hypothetical protein
VTRGENRHALRKVLEDLEVRLEAYLTEWREQLGFQENVGAGITCNKQPPESTGQKKGVETRHLK